MLVHFSKLIDSYQYQNCIDAITHYCRAEIYRGNARFVIYMNDKDISKMSEEREEEKPRTPKKEERKVVIGIIKYILYKK